MITLAGALAGTALKRPLPAGIAGAPVAGLAYDSRLVGPGFVFFAFGGSKVDGRVFAPQAVERGAVAVVSELPGPENFEGVWIEVAHGRRALASAARAFFGKPDERLGITGITGTNGKTTTSYLLDSILRAAGNTTALMGTIEYRLAGRATPAVNTTPESLDIFRFLAETEKAGGTHVTMEVSSHALALARVHAIQFHTAIFTNLTRDHLDFHRTMDNYFAAKSLLFEGAGARPPAFAATNHDDSFGRRIYGAPGARVYRYGVQDGADVRAVGVESDFGGVRFEIDFRGARHKIVSPLPGMMNAYNIMAAWCAARSYDIPVEVIARGIAECRAVPGRFEKVEAGQPFLVVVDYAHTDDALRNVIGVARALEPKRVITLFGCGGDRDRTKRPLMAAAAANGSDFVVLTSDNPRSEDPMAIINDAAAGLRGIETPHRIEPDRASAIRLAIAEAREGDIVIIAGKGHETYQVLKDATIHFDDREVAREALRERGYGGGTG